ncbi:hypothetical protein [Bradyrhizobium mercantei]|uniref:hypothetical protein n=1 Tax=Bradyrhizobium mercantei TaxID=1904807 RepID=UPI0011785394|nr:hypothetical protein [Bradyrhizobium mercantei]
MDPLSAETWKHHWEVIASAPYVLMPLVALALMVGWWIGNKLAGARVEGLNGTIENLKSHIELLESRFNFATAREGDVHRARNELEKQLLELRSEVATGVSAEKLAATSAKVDAAVTELSTANDSLAIALTSEGSELEFYTQLEQRLPGQTERLKEFVGSLKPLGVEPKYGKSLFLRWQTEDGLTLSAGTIEPTGSIWLLKSVTDARMAGNQSAGERYLKTVAQLTNGSIKRYESGQIDVRGPDGRALRLPSLTKIAPAWKEAISKLISDVSPRANVS